MDPLACPDPLAERRFAYALAAAAQGEALTAAELLEQALELAPGWAPAWFALGEARERLGELPGAAAAYAAALSADPGDRQGADARLAQLENRRVEELPPAYVARLFDDYAPRFARHLTESLHYCGPEVILAALDIVAPGRRFARALDLGCGSGLAGRALRPGVEWLAGVDISTGMIAQARATGIYDELEVGDLAAFMGGRSGVDLAVAADAFVYLGDLTPVFAAAAQALAPSGLLVFTIESGEAPFWLGPTMRFRHSDAHVREATAAAGMRVAHLAPASVRREAGGGAPGRVAAVAR